MNNKSRGAPPELKYLKKNINRLATCTNRFCGNLIAGRRCVLCNNLAAEECRRENGRKRDEKEWKRKTIRNTVAVDEMNDGLGSRGEMKFGGQINWRIPLKYKPWANREALRSRAYNDCSVYTRNNNEFISHQRQEIAIIVSAERRWLENVLARARTHTHTPMLNKRYFVGLIYYVGYLNWFRSPWTQIERIQSRLLFHVDTEKESQK